MSMRNTLKVVALGSALTGALACASLTGGCGGSDRPVSDRDGGIVVADSGVVVPDAGSNNNPDATPAGEDASTNPPPDAGSPPDDAGARPDTGVWRPLSADSPWNTPIGSSPAIDPDSAAMIEHFATSSDQWPWIDVAIAQYSVPVYFVDSTTTPMVNVNVTRVAGEGFHDDPRAPIPAGAMAAGGTDQHLAIVDIARGLEWDFWQARNNGGAWSCGVCATMDLTSNGIRPYPQQGRPDWWRSHGSRACGFPLTAGLITVDEIRAGRIDHALVLGYPGIRSRYFTPPASTAQAAFPGISPNEGIPCGGRIQLDPSIDVNTLGLSNTGRIIARALQEYGAFIGDGNGSISLYADASPTARAAWDGGLLRTPELRSLNLRAFRVLQLGQLYNDGN
ncbi:hypothetical protein L6R52_28165 [Myxococcota bacterium]|nr:hypothetical protein [Myxococcota bacterium]